jgi:hypothetical protein
MAALEQPQADLARCPRCGARFSCQPEGDCWCKRIPMRLPVPSQRGVACLCPACLAEITGEPPPSSVES